MATYHQSQLSSWADCPAQVGYEMSGLPTSQNSFMAFGSVMHNALEVLERMTAEARAKHKRGTDECWTAYLAAVESAVETFLFTWNPLNIEVICEPVPADGWAKGHGYSELRTKGVDSLRKYAEMLRYDDSELLATEYGFNVPIQGTWDEELGEPHRLGGSVDRLAARHVKAKLAVSCEDFKTGQIPPYLRHHLQFTAYCYATTQREFWVGDRGEDGFGIERGEELYQRFRAAGRHGLWISLKNFSYVDAGWRGPIDYDRFAIAITQLHASITADIFPLSISGSRCKYCAFRRSCAGTGIAPDEHGDPRVLVTL
jgi:hypothetical protein